MFLPGQFLLISILSSVSLSGYLIDRSIITALRCSGLNIGVNCSGTCAITKEKSDAFYACWHFLTSHAQIY